MNAVEKDLMGPLNTSWAVCFSSDLLGLSLRKRERAALGALVWWPPSQRAALELLL